jgi:hypothetical protein
MLQIAVAMNYLRESGVMYCDLKATNVFVSGGSQWIPYHLCKLYFEAFASGNLSCMTLGTTMPLVGTTQ